MQLTTTYAAVRHVQTSMDEMRAGTEAIDASTDPMILRTALLNKIDQVALAYLVVVNENSKT